MSVRTAAVALMMASLASCVAAPRPNASTNAVDGRPLDILPAEADLKLVRQDLLSTAAARFGGQSLQEALEAPTYFIAKRFAGMAPPPPPDAGPDWVAPTPTALLMKRPHGWLVATGNGWRPAKADAAAELDQVLADPRFWREPAYIPPCPDYGASLVLLKIPGKAERIGNSTCTSVGEKAVFAALRA